VQLTSSCGNENRDPLRARQQHSRGICGRRHVAARHFGRQLDRGLATGPAKTTLLMHSSGGSHLTTTVIYQTAARDPTSGPYRAGAPHAYLAFLWTPTALRRKGPSRVQQQVYDPRLRFPRGRARGRLEKNPDRCASRPMVRSEHA
jgi:hypothetical protein